MNPKGAQQYGLMQMAHDVVDHIRRVEKIIFVFIFITDKKKNTQFQRENYGTSLGMVMSVTVWNT